MLARQLADQLVDGLIVSPLDPSDAAWAEIGEALPIVTVGDALAGPTVGEVLFDNRAGVGLVLEHLHGLGHRRIAVLTPSRPSTPDRPAERVVAEVCDALGLDATVVNSPHSIEAATEAAAALLAREPRPTAVFCLSDSIACGVYAAAAAHGPRDPARPVRRRLRRPPDRARGRAAAHDRGVGDARRRGVRGGAARRGGGGGRGRAPRVRVAPGLVERRRRRAPASRRVGAPGDGDVGASASAAVDGVGGGIGRNAAVDATITAPALQSPRAGDAGPPVNARRSPDASPAARAASACAAASSASSSGGSSRRRDPQRRRRQPVRERRCSSAAAGRACRSRSPCRAAPPRTPSVPSEPLLPLPLQHAPERRGAGAEVRAARVVLEAGEPRRPAGQVERDRDVAEQPRAVLAPRVEVDEPDARAAARPPSRSRGRAAAARRRPRTRPRRGRPRRGARRA